MASSQSEPTIARIDRDKLIERIRELQTKEPCLLGITIWGWTGDGKTCNLLTALHYCEATTLGISFAKVRDTDDLEELQTLEEYRGIELAPIARASSAELSRLSEAFIDDAKWPPGTDQGNSYLVRLDDLGRTLAFALICDLPGGSYVEHDEAAKAVLRNMHACMLLVDAERFQLATVQGKAYRDDVLHRVKKCAVDKVPTAIVLTKQDKFDESTRKVVDDTQVVLELTTGQHADGTFQIFRASVVGDELDGPYTAEDPPPAQQRGPSQLIQAWGWLAVEALSKGADQIRKRPPPTQLRRIASSPRSIARQTLPELRKIGEYSNCPGTVLCAVDGPDSDSTFLVLSPDNGLFSAKMGESSEQPEFVEGGPLGKSETQADATPGDDREASCVAGHLVLSSRRDPPAIWSGPIGDLISAAPLPAEVASWKALDPKHLLAIDTSGRLQLLALSGDRWTQAQYISEFVPASPHVFCGFVATESLALAFSGQAAAAVMITPSWEFGTRVSCAEIPACDNASSNISPLGVVVSVPSSNQLQVSYSEATAMIDGVGQAPCLPFSVANRTPVVAFVSAQSRLHLCVLSGNEWQTTADDLSPALPGPPSALVWSGSDSLLVASYPDGTWDLFRPFGIDLP